VSVPFLLIVSTFAFVAPMAARPRLRRLLSENVARRAAPITVWLFGPLSPKAFVATFVRAAKARRRARRSSHGATPRARRAAQAGRLSRGTGCCLWR
jgi:hypothetical protein